MGVFGRQKEVILVQRVSALSEVFARDVLKYREAERVEQEVPDLVLFLDEAAWRQAESVAHSPGEKQDVQLRQRPLTATALHWRLQRQNNNSIWFIFSAANLKGLISRSKNILFML